MPFRITYYEKSCSAEVENKPSLGNAYEDKSIS